MRVTLGNFHETIQYLSGRSEIGADSETTGLEYTDRPFALILGDRERVFYFDERELTPSFWREPALKALLLEDKVWVFQNAKFDMMMLERMGLTMGGAIHDIAVMARIKDNTFLSYSLENQSKRAGGEQKSDVVKAYIKEHDLYETRTSHLGETYQVPCYHKVPIEIMEAYAVQDVVATLSLWDKYVSEMDSGDMAVFNNEAKLTRVCYAMERRGICVDKEYTKKAYEDESKKVADLKAQFQMSTGLEYINSADHLCPIFEKIGEKVHVTKKGSPSLTDDILEMYTTPLAKLVQEIRFYDKRISTYFKPYLEKVDPAGKLHPWMWQAGTRTGRFSYSDPNLQNIPKEEASDTKVRRCIVPSKGNIFLSFDYSQMEYFLMVAYANELQVIKQIMQGVDFHQATADLLGVPRKQAKTLNFAILYGAGLDKIAHMLGCTRDEAKRLKVKYFLALPRVESLVKNIIDTGKKRGYVINWLGRKLRSEWEFCYALPNHLIQGGGADIVKVAMSRLQDAGLCEGLCLQIHDQLVWDVPERWARDNYAKIKEILEDVWEKNGVRLRVDASYSAKSLAEEDMAKWI